VKDTYKHVDPDRLQATGAFLLGFLRSLDRGDLEKLAQSRTAQ
jgi:hypothetical protein